MTHPFPPAGFQNAVVVAKQALSPEVVGLRCLLDAPLPFAAGQWVDFVLPGLDAVGGYSMTSTPLQMAQAGTLDLAVRRGRGQVTRAIHDQLAVGDRVALRVGGTCFLDETRTTPLLLIAGGIGVNPLWSMLQTLAQRTPQRPVTFCYCSKQPQTTLFRDEILATLGACRDGRAAFFWTDAQAKDLPVHLHQADPARTRFHFSRPTAADLIGAATAPAAALCAYLCGPPAMIDALAAALPALGLSDLHYEKWW